MEETNIYELLTKAEEYRNPSLLTKIFNDKKYLLEKSYDYYTQAINILIYKKDFKYAAEIYPNVIDVLINMDISGEQLALEYCKFANVIYKINKEKSVKTYECALCCYEKSNNKDNNIKEILLKIINIYDELKLYNELINYLEKYKLNYNDNELFIKLGDCYIRNDNIYKAYDVYKENYNKTKDKNSFLKYFLCNICLGLEKTSDLLYPPLDFIQELLFIEQLSTHNLIKLNHEDEIVNILLNIIVHTNLKQSNLFGLG